MLECRDIDTLMVDWLYRELDHEQEGRFDEHLQGCARCQDELGALERTRAAVRELPEEEPPSSITAILLHEAAKQAPAGKPATPVAVEDDEPKGILGWLVGLLNPIVAHPAAAAVATLVLVAGIAGSLYLRGDHRVATPEVASGAPEPARPAIAEGMMRMPDEARAAEEPMAPGATAQAWGDDIGTETTTAELDGKLDFTTRKEEVTGGKDSNRQPLARPKAKVPPLANAVSGTDVLIDLDEAEEAQRAEGRSKAAPAKKPMEKKADKPVSSRSTRRAPATDPAPSFDKAPPPPVTTAAPPAEPGRYRVYNQDSAEQKEAARREWTLGKQNQLDKALQLKRCREAAKIANDILDRNPDYYYDKVSRSKSIKTCSGFVEAERKSRQQKRAKRKSKGSSAPKQMKAAPRDEAAEQSK